MSLKEHLAEYQAGWYKRVPAERQAIMERHIDQLRGSIGRTMLKVGDRAPAIVLENANGATVGVDALLKKGPVIVAFYRGGWCPFCKLELKAYQEILPEIVAAGASLVAISPERPDDTVSTAEKNALTFEVLSDVGQKVGRAFGLVYESALIVGAHTEAQVLANVSSMQATIPPEFWTELKRQNLIEQSAPTPAAT
jgi:peroxiredoxin